MHSASFKTRLCFRAIYSYHCYQKLIVALHPISTIPQCHLMRPRLEPSLITHVMVDTRCTTIQRQLLQTAQQQETGLLAHPLKKLNVQVPLIALHFKLDQVYELIYERMLDFISQMIHYTLKSVWAVLVVIIVSVSIRVCFCHFTVIRCQLIPFIKNAYPSTQRTISNTSVIYTCQYGFAFRDRTFTKVITCSGNGTWVGDIYPECEG